MTAKVWVPPPIGFRIGVTTEEVSAWIEDFRQAMLFIGLVQTDDVGQFDADTFSYPITLPSLTTGPEEITYLMLAFDDELQATSPIFIRVGIVRVFGNGTYGYAVGSSVIVGQATDGSGNVLNPSNATTRLVGVDVAANAHYNTPPVSYISYASMSKEKGFVGVVYSGGPHAVTGFDQRFAPVFFMVERIPDQSGSPTAEGFTTWGPRDHYRGRSNYSNSIEFTNSPAMMSETIASGVSTGLLSHSVPYFGSAELLEANSQVMAMHAFHSNPLPIRSNGVAAIQRSMLAKGTEFDLEVYGVSPSNFIAMDFNCGVRPSHATTQTCLAFLFE